MIWIWHFKSSQSLKYNSPAWEWLLFYFWNVLSFSTTPRNLQTRNFLSLSSLLTLGAYLTWLGFAYQKLGWEMLISSSHKLHIIFLIIYSMRRLFILQLTESKGGLKGIFTSGHRIYTKYSAVFVPSWLK